MKVTSDYQLLDKLQMMIEDLPYERKIRLNSLKKCCRRSITTEHGVTITSNGEKVKMHNVATCGNNWACPICTNYRMARYSSIATDAIKMLAEQGYVAFMCTLTIFNAIKFEDHYFTCKELLTILKQSYNKLIGGGTNYLKRNVFKPLEIKYFIRGCEITYGKNGWHPHYHILYFLPKENLQKVKDYEEIFWKHWQDCVIYTAKQVTGVDISAGMFFNKEKRQGLYISKNKKGDVTASTGGGYICGYDDAEFKRSANELYNSYKKTQLDGQYNVFQLLESDDERLNRLFIEYAEATKEFNRVNMTKGLIKQVEEWRLTHESILVEKKKESAEQEKSFQTVCWFSSQQWYEILTKSKYDRVYFLSLLAKFARDFDFDNIVNLCLAFNYPPPLKESPHFKLVNESAA